MNKFLIPKNGTYYRIELSVGHRRFWYTKYQIAILYSSEEIFGMFLVFWHTDAYFSHIFLVKWQELVANK